MKEETYSFTQYEDLFRYLDMLEELASESKSKGMKAEYEYRVLIGQWDIELRIVYEK